MPYSVLGEDSGIWKSEFVGVTEVTRHVPKGTDSLAALVGVVVEAFFQLALAVLLRVPGDGFRRRFGGFSDALTGKPKLISPRRKRDIYFSPTPVGSRQPIASFTSEGLASTVAAGQQEKVSVGLDLRKVTTGAHFLSTTHEQDEAAYYYPLQIK